MYITNVDKVREYTVDMDGACGVKVKYLLHKGVGAKKIQLRLFTINGGGHTPLEKHAHEHEVFVLRGSGILRGKDKETPVKVDDVIFIPSFEEHQFENVGEEPLQFLCTKETFEEQI